MGCAASSSAPPGGAGGASGSKPAPKKGTAAGCSDEYKKFKDAFFGLCQPDAASKELRIEAWKQADPNGNGQCSLAELDGWVQKTLLTKYPKEGETIWKAFRPSYIRAFSDARDIGADKQLGKSNCSTDDFVQARTFRVFVAYLVIYAEMYDAFALVDGGGAGVSKDDDRKISPDELKAGADKLKGFSFVFAKDLTAQSADAVFKEMDDDGKGAVLLNEWCRYIEQAEQKAGTEMGKLLGIGDDEKA